jgi:hypothetical protein
MCLGVAELVDAVALGAIHYGFKSRCPLLVFVMMLSLLKILNMFFFRPLLTSNFLQFVRRDLQFSDLNKSRFPPKQLVFSFSEAEPGLSSVPISVLFTEVPASNLFYSSKFLPRIVLFSSPRCYFLIFLFRLGGGRVVEGDGL